jgi:hypothetical protein
MITGVARDGVLQHAPDGLRLLDVEPPLEELPIDPV